MGRGTTIGHCLDNVHFSDDLECHERCDVGLGRCTGDGENDCCSAFDDGTCMQDLECSKSNFQANANNDYNCGECRSCDGHHFPIVVFDFVSFRMCVERKLRRLDVGRLHDVHGLVCRRQPVPKQRNLFNDWHIHLHL